MIFDFVHKDQKCTWLQKAMSRVIGKINDCKIYNGQRKRSIHIISSKFDTKDPSVNENFIQQQRITFN